MPSRRTVFVQKCATCHGEDGGGTLIDSVDYGQGFPVVSGASLSLIPGGDAAANDAGAAWCRATVAYATGDLGSPGAANPDCP